MSHFPRLMLLSVVVLLSIATAFFAWRQQTELEREGFETDKDADTDTDADADADAGPRRPPAAAAATATATASRAQSTYSKRMYILQLFDVLLKRRPSADELERFSEMSQKGILDSVVALVDPGMPAAGDAQNADDGQSKQTPPPPPPTLPPTPPPPPPPPPAQRQTQSHTLSKPKTTGDVDDSGRVCIERAEVLARLGQISDLIEQFVYRVGTV